MKKKILLIISLFFATLTFGQNNCQFTYSTAGALNVVAFSPINTVPAPPYRYLWSFGDGGSSNDTAPVHVYNSFGTFNVCCSVYDANQLLFCSWCDSVIVGNPTGGGCSFIASIDTATSQVVFTAQPSGAFSIIHWDFGNGDSAVGSVATYTYLTPGVYSVCMSEIDNFLGTIVCTFCSTIVIGNNGGGNCSFTATVDSTNSSLVHFTANVNAGDSVIWYFGDNTSGTGLTVSHLYNGVGPYNVCMEASPDGFITVCNYCAWVTPGNPAGNCSFTFRADTSNTNLIYFVGTGSSPGSGIIWDFGDGSNGQGNMVSHIYAATGTYYVCMTEYFNGAVVCTSCSYVTIGGPIFGCQAYFQSVSLGLTGYFIDLSTANVASTTYSWDFGDGGTSTTRFPNHLYTLPGTYNVCLNIADPLNAGCSSQYCAPITVDTVINTPTGCQAYFVILQVAPYQFVVVNLSSGINLNFNWDFGDGSTSQQAYPSHSYSTTGTYNLCLTVSSGPACSSTYCDTLSVDSLGNIFRSTNTGFTINVLSPAQLTGVTETAAPTLFAVYPNPATSLLTVSITSGMKGTALYKVYALDGTEVSAGTFTKNVNKLNVAQWQQGVYILEVSDAQGFRSYQKIIKE